MSSSPSRRAADFRRLFAPFGTVTKVTLYPARAHAFLDFESPDCVEHARGAEDIDLGAGPVGMEVSRASARQQANRARRSRGTRD